jgi:hypothetical protein
MVVEKIMKMPFFRGVILAMSVFGGAALGVWSAQYYEGRFLLAAWAALAVGVLVGYHIGLDRASKSIWEAQGIAPPVRDIVIRECLKAISDDRPILDGSVVPDDYFKVKWTRYGFDQAISAVRRVQCGDVQPRPPAMRFDPKQFKINIDQDCT